MGEKEGEGNPTWDWRVKGIDGDTFARDNETAVCIITIIIVLNAAHAPED